MKDRKKGQANIDGEDRGDGIENTGKRQGIYGTEIGRVDISLIL